MDRRPLPGYEAHCAGRPQVQVEGTVCNVQTGGHSPDEGLLYKLEAPAQPGGPCTNRRL